MDRKDILGRWGDRAGAALTLWSVLPQSLIAVVTAVLATSVSWISQFGAFGIFTAGLVGFVLASVGLAQATKWRLYRHELKQRAKISGDSSPFDPMATVYENKRLYLRDLAPMGRRYVVAKRFINCEIIGPGVAMVGMASDPSKPPLMRNSHTLDGVDCIEVDPSPERRSTQAIEFVDCDFDGCKFYHMSLLFTGRDNEGLHWITRRSEQMLLPDTGGSLR